MEPEAQNVYLVFEQLGHHSVDREVVEAFLHKEHAEAYVQEKESSVGPWVYYVEEIELKT